MSSDPALKTVHLCASGPGLMFHSPSAAAAFELGADYSSNLRPGVGAVGEAVASGRVVLLSTGSPGLDYTLVFHDAGSSEIPIEAPLASAQFSLVVTDGCLLVRDGYVTTRWGDEGYATERVALRNGFYLVDARWMASSGYGHMLIHLVFGRTDDPPSDCPGWVDLDYVAT